MTILQLRDRCRAWLDDPSHRPRFDSPEAGRNQDNYDLQEQRTRISEVMFACNCLMRSAYVLQLLTEAEAVTALLGEVCLKVRSPAKRRQPPPKIESRLPQLWPAVYQSVEAKPIRPR